LFVSDDGLTYRLLTHLDVPGRPNETTLRFLPGDETSTSAVWSRSR
jgi:hypothetical protein